MGPKIILWHRECCRVIGKLVYYIVKQKGSRAGLEECAIILERVAKGIRNELRPDNTHAGR